MQQDVVPVAIIGGGASGLALAWTLAKSGISSHLFDTGRRTVGGRCSSRQVAPESKSSHYHGASIPVDHSCQWFQPSNANENLCGVSARAYEEYCALVQELETAGVIRSLKKIGKGGIVEITVGSDEPKSFEQNKGANDVELSQTFAGSPRSGLAGIPHWLETNSNPHCKVFGDVWISKFVRDSENSNSDWMLERKLPPQQAKSLSGAKGRYALFSATRDGKDPARYKYVVIAHCGKCATRLVKTSMERSSAEWPLLQPLRCRFLAGYGFQPGGQAGKGKGKTMKPSEDKLDIASRFVAVLEILEDVAARSTTPAIGYTFCGDKRLASASNNTAKAEVNNVKAWQGTVWTLVSTAEYASEHKCTQEAMPEDVKKTVTYDLLTAFAESVLQMAKVGTLPRVKVHTIQLWGAALPLNRVACENGNPGFLLDTSNHLAVVGDWLLGASLGSALLSGVALGRKFCDSVFSGKTSSDNGLSSRVAFERIPDSIGGLGFSATGSVVTSKQAIGAGAGHDHDQQTPQEHDKNAWKWAIRHKIWDHLEKTNIAQFPRPVHHRIPNFKGAVKATHEFFQHLSEFTSAKVVKINPDTPQKECRKLTMALNKVLYVPQPRLRTGFFSRVAPGSVAHKDISWAATADGMKHVGVPLGFKSIGRSEKVDLVVIGSVAVNKATGARIGKGEGFAELEYGILRMMGCIDAETPVVTVVHDCQLLEEGALPPKPHELMAHDVCVDVIVTPTQVIRIAPDKKPKKPEGIYWELLSPQKLAQVSVLREVKQWIEERDGVALPSGPHEALPPTADRESGVARKMAKAKNRWKRQHASS